MVKPQHIERMDAGKCILTGGTPTPGDCRCMVCNPSVVAKPKLRDKTSIERKAEPIVTGALRYFPDAIAAMARLSVAGNSKHNPGESLHWARSKSTDQDDCAGRHLLTPDAVDPETGETELVAAFWRLGAAVQLQQERLLAAKGIRPYSGITP